ncbi:MAG: hypothetical protein K2N47_05580 [Clostridia bacterium]|nr:hypothetical protein [Clostridia bacterium]
MKSVLISIQPYYVFLIIARLMGWDIVFEKKIEVRKDFPKDFAWNRTVYIYCSKNRNSFNRIPAQYQPFMAKLLGKVVGKFVCNKIDCYDYDQHIGYPTPTFDGDVSFCDCGEGYWITAIEFNEICLSYEELCEYGKSKPLYGWQISDLVIYDTPKALGEFKLPCQRGYNDINNAWCYRERGVRLTMCKYNDMKNSRCNAYLTRALQSWCYVEE